MKHDRIFRDALRKAREEDGDGEAAAAEAKATADLEARRGKVPGSEEPLFLNHEEKVPAWVDIKKQAPSVRERIETSQREHRAREAQIARAREQKEQDRRNKARPSI